MSNHICSLFTAFKASVMSGRAVEENISRLLQGPNQREGQCYQSDQLRAIVTRDRPFGGGRGKGGGGGGGGISHL